MISAKQMAVIMIGVTVINVTFTLINLYAIMG